MQHEESSTGSQYEENSLSLSGFGGDGHRRHDRRRGSLRSQDRLQSKLADYSQLPALLQR